METGNVCVVTGAGGLVGSQCVNHFSKRFKIIIAIDNNERAEFFGDEASTKNIFDNLCYFGNDDHQIINTHEDITHRDHIEKIFKEYNLSIGLIIHCAAQPSHDFAASQPYRDFEINAVGTLNLLESARKYCPNAAFIFTSTNKVYGDRPNTDLKYVELPTRYEVYGTKVEYLKGIDEHMSIDNTTHSLFGVSKTSADLMCQEYARYFNMNIGIFRCGCLTGKNHKGSEQHGFLSYLIKCMKHDLHYNIYGTGKQVRDNIHSIDLVNLFDEFYKNPTKGEVYNVGGGRENAISILEAISKVNDIRISEGLTEWMDYDIRSTSWRKGDHKWYISDLSKVKSQYPNWSGIKIKTEDILRDIYYGIE